MEEWERERERERGGLPWNKNKGIVWDEKQEQKPTIYHGAKHDTWWVQTHPPKDLDPPVLDSWRENQVRPKQIIRDKINVTEFYFH